MRVKVTCQQKTIEDDGSLTPTNGGLGRGGITHTNKQWRGRRRAHSHLITVAWEGEGSLTPTNIGAGGGGITHIYKQKRGRGKKHSHLQTVARAGEGSLTSTNSGAGGGGDHSHL